MSKLNIEGNIIPVGNKFKIEIEVTTKKKRNRFESPQLYDTQTEASAALLAACRAGVSTALESGAKINSVHGEVDRGFFDRAPDTNAPGGGNRPEALKK